MKKKLFPFIILLSLYGIQTFAQADHYFNLTFNKNFPNGESNQVAYINFPDVTTAGWIEITITGSYSHQLTKGKLTKRFALVRNTTGYHNQSSEIPTAFGEIANQWKIGDYDNDSQRIPIYHLVSTGNTMTIQVTGVLKHGVDPIISNLTISDPVTVPNSETRHYTSIMQDRVGIGTKSPTAKLEIGKSNLENAFSVGSSNDGGRIYTSYESGKGTLNFVEHDDPFVLSFTQAGTNTNEKIIFDQGNFGIGTTTMGSHKLAVEGSIGAREIKVEANGWSDFVFENTYQLPSLKEVENHIQQKGHLKDIPSAKEVKENGIFLGEMDAKLLQKIEELTLYTIAQEKKILSLEKQNSTIQNLEKEIEILKEENKEIKQLNKKLIELQNKLDRLIQVK